VLNKLRISKSLLILGLFFGIGCVNFAGRFFQPGRSWQICLGIGAFLLFYLLSSKMLGYFSRLYSRVEDLMDVTSIDILLGGTGGLLLGITIGVLCSYPLSRIGGVGDFLSLLVFILSSFLGLKMGIRRGKELLVFLPQSSKEGDESLSAFNPKVLDTSAIIDGRIYDVCLSNFLDGSLLAPNFVIEELQHIADSSDNIRRNKGRRGLELLGKMQKHPRINIDIIEDDIMEEKEVDAKLLRLCKQLGASIITNDYNLNKVAELQGIKVLNINELTNAVKIMVYPGETMHTCIVREGKEVGQGIGYLEDGTMVVVEQAHDEIGNDIEVVVTSVFQTAAGRMIFTRKVKEEKEFVVDSFKEVQEVNLYG